MCLVLASAFGHLSVTVFVICIVIRWCFPFLDKITIFLDVNYDAGGILQCIIF